MQRAGRYVFAGLAWAFVVGVVVQVFLAGVGLFGVSGMDLHVGFGYFIVYLPLLMLIATLAARPDRRTVWLTVALFVFGSVIQPTLPFLRTVSPFIAALHPPNALLVFSLAAVVARRSLALARPTARAATMELANAE